MEYMTFNLANDIILCMTQRPSFGWQKCNKMKIGASFMRIFVFEIVGSLYNPAHRYSPWMNLTHMFTIGYRRKV